MMIEVCSMQSEYQPRQLKCCDGNPQRAEIFYRWLECSGKGSSLQQVCQIGVG